MNVHPCLSTIDIDDPWTTNLRSLRLEELVDASSAPGRWPPGLPGPVAGEARLLPEAARVVAQVDSLLTAIVGHDAPLIAQATRNLDTTVGACPELAALAARRLRRLVQSPWIAGPRLEPALTPALKATLDTLLARLDHARSRPAPALHTAVVPALGVTSAREFADAPGPRLSARELQVARLVSQGMTNKQIAIALKLSPNTIKRHLARILRRLGMGKRAALASWYAVQPRADALAPAGHAAGALAPLPALRASIPYLPLPARAEPVRNASLHP